MAKWRVKAEVCKCGDYEEYTLIIPDGQYPHDMLLLKESRKQWGEPAIKILDKWRLD